MRESMQLTSTGYLLFLLIGVLLYYGLPKKQQWKVLLVMSVLFYCMFDIRLIGYIIVSTVSVFFAAKAIEPLKRGTSKKKKILVFTLILNFGLLAFVKYTEFLLDNVNALLKSWQIGYTIPGMEILVPVGISFYTFQITGYLLDVYWGRDKAETSLPRFFLFASFFPQIIQGPISKHKTLGAELNKEHSFSIQNIKYGLQLMLFGFFKKLVIADTAAVAVNTVFSQIDHAYGLTVIAGILCYCIQLYCDFSGGIDVIRGSAELFGITMQENFKRPFFSKSIAEFWRRWHISLGIWMKDYIFYPISLSKWMNKMGQRCRKLFGSQIGRKLPVCFANIIVFFLVGIWHGPNWQFIVYGIYNGLIIAISSLLTPWYQKLYDVTHIRKESVFMKVFQMIRTFLLVNLGWYFDRSTCLTDAFVLMKHTLIRGTEQIHAAGFLGLHKYQYAYMLIGCMILFTVSVLQEKGMEVRKRIDTLPLLIKWALWLMLLFAIPLMGYFSPDASVGGFMYANF